MLACAAAAYLFARVLPGNSIGPPSEFTPT
jgi:hypothetical protein